MQRQFAGSRKHILDWVSEPDFSETLVTLLKPLAITPLAGRCKPLSFTDPDEVDLAQPTPLLLSPEISLALRQWWLAVPHARARTPNWDLAAAARFSDGRQGLVLIEAKAHERELVAEAAGKRLLADASADSKRNHEQIENALAEVAQALGGDAAGARIGTAQCYQFSNRVAFAWKLASLGVPVALVYLGFTGDSGLGAGFKELRDEGHWKNLIARHTEPVLPASFWERPIPTSNASFWLLARSRHRLAPSPPIEERRARPWILESTGPLPPGASDKELWDELLGDDHLPTDKDYAKLKQGKN